MAFHLFTMVDHICWIACLFVSFVALCALHDSQFVTQFDSGSFLGRIPFLCGHIFRVCLQHRSIMDLCSACISSWKAIVFFIKFSYFESNFTNSVYKTEFWLFCLCLVALCVFVFVLPHILCHCSRCPFHCGQFLPLVGNLLVIYVIMCSSLSFYDGSFFNWIFVTVHWGSLCASL